MPKKTFPAFILMMLILSILTFTSDLHGAEASTRTWFVDDNGVADFHTIQEAVDAALPYDTIRVHSGVYKESVALNKPLSIIGESAVSTIVEGINDSSDAFEVNAPDMLITNFTIQNSLCGIDAFGQRATIIENRILYNVIGVYLQSSNCTVTLNEISWNYVGVGMFRAFENLVRANQIIQNDWIGVSFEQGSEYNLVESNEISLNGYRPTWEGFLGGIFFSESSNNTLTNNNIINNSVQVKDWAWENIGFELSVNVWNEEYPYGGNYWSQYAGADLLKGPFENETGSDGIGDLPCFIGTSNLDRYPFMKPYPWDLHDLGVTGLVVSKNVTAKGSDLVVNATIFNYGNSTEKYTATFRINTTEIGTFLNLTLTSRNSTLITITWNTSNFSIGTYTIWVHVLPVLGETLVDDNTLSYGTVKLTILGDISGDFKVEPYDIALLIASYGSDPYPPNPRPWNANADINGDGKVDQNDLDILIDHYGQHCP